MVALTATADHDAGAVLLEVTGAAAGAASIVRADANGSTLVRLRQGQAPIAGALTVTDYEPALTGLVSYTVTDAAGASAGDSATFNGPPPLTGAEQRRPRLADVQVPSRSAVLEVVTGYSSGRESSSTVHDVIGRADPVVVFGPTRLRRGRLTFRHSDHVAALAVADVLTAGKVLMLRQADHDGLDLYLVASRVSTDPAVLARDGWRWETVADYVEVRSPALPLLGTAGWSYADVLAGFSSYAAVRDTFADYSDLVVGS